MQGNFITRPVGAMVARVTQVQKAACSNHVRVRVQLFYQFLRVDAIDIILIVISVYARKRHHKAWWRNGSASDSSSECCVFKSCRGQLLFQFLRVDAFDIISIVICVHAMKRYVFKST